MLGWLEVPIAGMEAEARLGKVSDPWPSSDLFDGDGQESMESRQLMALHAALVRLKPASARMSRTK